MRILHVIESLGGGVLSSVLSMVEATPELEHQLAVWPRRTHPPTGDGLELFDCVHTLRSGPFMPALRSTAGVIGEVQPDRIHAHSSYAGLLVRMLSPDVDVVYSPHCFGFERLDLAAAPRDGVRRVERALSGRTAVLAACSPREAGLGQALGYRRVVTVPNRALAVPDLRARPGRPFRVVTAGRIGPQKDWRYLLMVKGYLEEVLGCHAEWEWLGAGDHQGEQALRAHGVTVSGWLPRSEVMSRLGQANTYVHTAAWEGAPVSLLEAAAVGLPIAARGIPSLLSLDLPGATSSAAELAARIVQLHDPDVWEAEQERSLQFANGLTPDLQRRRLHLAYQLVPADSLLR